MGEQAVSERGSNWIWIKRNFEKLEARRIGNSRDWELVELRTSAASN